MPSTDVPLTFCPEVKMDLFPSDWGHKSIMFNGFYELELTKSIHSLAKNGGLLIDVGANYGYFTCLWAGANISNRAIAFEAAQSNILPLKRNIVRNGFVDRVKVIPKAVGKDVGKIRFSPGGSIQQTSWGSIVIHENATEPKVPIITLDEYFRHDDVTWMDVLKIDTEGADTWVLYGAKKLLKQKRIKHIFFEHNIERMSVLGIKKDEAGNFLRDLGYQLEIISENEFHAFII